MPPSPGATAIDPTQSAAAIGAPSPTQMQAPAPIGPPPAVPDKLAPAPPSLPAADQLATADTAGVRHPLREAIAERAEERRAAHAGPVRVAIDTSGDPALTIPAEALIEQKLSGAGLQVVDSPRGADVVVRVSTQVIGNQDISFYGQNAVLTTAYLTVKPYAGSRALGPGLRQKIDYTPMSAEAKVQEALGPGLDRVVNSARDGR
jgi:serine/threonine-protein kinase